MRGLRSRRLLGDGVITKTMKHLIRPASREAADSYSPSLLQVPRIPRI